MFEQITTYLTENLWLKILIESYLIFIVISAILYLIAHTKKAFFMCLSVLFMTLISIFTYNINLKFISIIYFIFSIISLLFTLVVLADEFKKTISIREKSNIQIINVNVIHEIISAVSELSEEHVGALITIEMRNSVEQFVTDSGVKLNSDISKELLLNIFTVKTALHDGAVIIRGNKILYAAAYYNLSGSEEDKSVGSRHRAAKSISEKTDSITIVVSEETGQISLATNGNLHITTKESLENMLTNIYGKDDIYETTI